MILRTALEEERAKKAVQDYLNEHRREYFTLSQEAHCFLFGTTPDLNQGHVNWIQHGLVEPHVTIYLKRIGKM